MGAKPDFSGYATKAGIRCSDGRTITPEAFKHMDGSKVPLLWQHGHNSPDNVLGHVLLTAVDDGMRADGYFNDTKQGKNAKTLVEHDDIDSMSIWANGLVEKAVKGAKAVLHGVIREVSLVLSGANPGAKIDFVAIQHSDDPDDVTVSDDTAIIYTGLKLEHAVKTYATKSSSTTTDLVDGKVVATRTTSNDSTRTLDDGSSTDLMYSDLEHATVQEVYDTLTEEQKNVVHYMIGAALDTQTGGSAKQSGTNKDDKDDSNTDKEGTGEMRHNVFETGNDKGKSDTHSLSHEDVKGIVADAVSCGSLKDAVKGYALKHGIENIDVLFPDAKSLTDRPEFDKRQTEWVAGVLNGTRHTPFSRVKSLVADLTFDDARAKGYVKGNLKKEEFFRVSKRITGPTTIYKKQKLDRDDILDITDFDVVAWLKMEMEMMLKEELGRAILIGDGRAVDDDDKIKDPAAASDGSGIRSILNEHELYATTVNINIGATPNYNTIVEDVLRALRFYKGTGRPTLYTTAQVLTEMLLTKDGMQRRLWANVGELATAMRLKEIVEVEPMENETDLFGIIVNLTDYNIGTDRGGEVNFFDDFDIDYNQYKYLYETRLSGALVKIKSALILKKTDVANELAVPTKPTFVSGTGVVTIPTVEGVVYQDASDDSVLSAGAQTALDPGATLTVHAVPDTGYYFATNANDEWPFTRPAA
jgi:HK97 family phage prohead protease